MRHRGTTGMPAKTHARVFVAQDSCRELPQAYTACYSRSWERIYVRLQVAMTLAPCACIQHVMHEAVEWSCKQKQRLLHVTWRVWHHHMLAAAV